MSLGPPSTSRDSVMRAIARREKRQTRLRWRLFIVLFAGVVVLDQITKTIIRSTLEPGGHVEVFPGFDISRVTNDGIAFGLFPGRQAAVAVLTVVALSAIAIALAGMVRRNATVAAGAGLLVGGSVGNLLDRLVRGGVTDFLDPVRWPAFNIADMAIVVGAAAIVIGLTKDVGDDDHGS